ncbi:non-ribosomal peptide synthetase [Colletotrichum tabaci]|uniref:Non-ribosomal peptide synthetase n=1 Tax=Colletotrichum tabaci TaxID=1209068 RepID=A0AAV9TCE3_9PEZI
MDATMMQQPSRHGSVQGCIFPPLPGGQPSDDEERTASVDWHDEMAATRNDINAAWCVLLHLYSDADEVCFGCQRSGDGGRAASSVLSYTIRESDTLGEVATALNNSYGAREGLYSSTVSWNTSTRFAAQHDDRSSGDEQGDTAAALLMLLPLLPPGVDLALDVLENHDGTINNYRMVYRPTIMSDDEAQNVAATFKHILALLHASPDQQVATLNPSQRDVDRIMAWHPYPGTGDLKQDARLVHEVFREQVRSRPSWVAIDAWDGRLTYKELDDASDRLRDRLRQAGLGPGDGVLLCFEKSVWMSVAMLAVLKTGAFCSNLDPDYPEHRVTQIAEATEAAFLVASQAQLKKLKGYEISQQLCLIQVPSNGGDEHEHDTILQNESRRMKQQLYRKQQTRPSPNSTAFVVFTSGSTGVPKGIVVSHANVCTAVAALGDAFGVDSATRTVQFAAHSWDVSVQDYLGSLLRGATVCVPSDDERWNDLEGYMARTAVNWAHLTPTVARTLRPGRTSKSLRTLLLVGEPMGDADIAGWVEAGTRAFNVYGCTEATWVQVSRPKNGAQVGRGHVSGYGINTRVWIVRRGDQALSPVGCRGEIWLEGPMVTQGYINVDPLLEQRSFPNRPDWAERLLGRTHDDGQHRYYRTGDLGRLCAHGALEVMGRTDTQAKLGGQRLELSEVEHYLREASAFQAASVFIPKAGPFAGRLTAVLGDLPMGGSIEGRHNHHHLRPSKDEEDDEDEALEPQLVRCSPPMAAEIATKLGKVLPSFMVPVVWMSISRFPMTASGKLARSRILSQLETMAGWVSDPAQYGELARHDEVDVLLPETPPGDSTPGEEAFLQHVCASLLGIEPASVDLGKSFVSLGGDSIRAMQIVARYRAVGKRITVGQLFNSRCLLEVAAQVEGLQDVLADGKREDGTDQNQQPSEQQAADFTGRSAVRKQIEDMGEALLSLPTINSLDDVEDVFPLSPMQDSLALSLARLGGRFYMDEFVWEVQAADGSRIDMDRLEQAWEAVVARHQALRTVFVEVEVDADVPDKTMTGSSMPLYQVVLRRSPASCQRVWAMSDDDVPHVAREHPRLLDTLSHHQLIHAGLPTHSMLMVYHDGDGNGDGNGDGHGRVWCRLEVSHLVEDAMSILPLLRDVSLAYRHSTEGPGPGPGIGSLTVGGEFVRYIRNRERHEASLAYWSSHLEGAQPCLFPSLVDSSRESKSEHVSDDVSSGGQHREQRVVQVALNDPRTHGLQQAVARLGLTLPTFFQTIWALVLHIYSGKTDVVFGNVASGRDIPVPGIEEAFGSFLGILVCRVDLGRDRQRDDDDDDDDDAGVETEESGSQHGRTLLNIMKEIQRATIEGSSNQSCSLAEMQEAAGLLRDRSSRVPLFNTGISCRPLITESDQEDFALRFQQMENRELTEMDLALIIETGQDAMSVYLQYQPWFMSDAAAANVAETVSHLVTEALLNPRRSVQDVGKVSPRDLAQIWDWNKEGMPPVEEVMHSFVEERMRASPGRQAVCSWDGDMTYGELDRATGCVAQYLRDSCGVVPDSVVPICSEKSIWAVVAMLGVMRAGGCFVMLDPGHPDSRLLSIVEQVRPRVMLSSSRQRARLERWARDLDLSRSKSKDDGLSSPISVQVLAITEDWVKRRMTMTETSGLPICICPEVRPRHAMYVQFTSGTTGAPKGVVISHRNFATGFRRHCAATEVWPHTRALQFSAYSFDSSVGEILTTLAVGGCLCSPSDEDRSMAIVAFIARSGANWAAWTPSFASLIDPDDVPSLDAMCLAGEPLSASLVDRWADRVRMVNIYGPSECSMASTVNNPVTRDSLPSNIGRAHRSVTWIVDEDDHERLQPIGAVGELLIEGPVVADAGYLGRPDVTSRVFIGAPSWLRSGPHARPGARLYKTGDLVRYSSDGSINYVGRKDTQLKIHGQRVEVGDIEQHLRVCIAKIVQGGGGSPSVAVELLHKQEEQQHGSEVLAAFIVVGDGNAGDSRDASCVSDGNRRQQDRDGSRTSLDLVASDPRALAGFRSLVERIRHSTLPLPSYMIPRIFVPLKTLPTTTAGKLDRRALHRVAADMGRQRLVSFSVQPEPGSNNKSSSDAVITDTRVEEQQNPRDSEPSSVEDMVTGFVARLLGLDTVGILDDFFNLGGNSVVAIRLSGMARRHNLALSVADIFEKPRIIDMVARIRAVREAASTTTINVNGEDSHLTVNGSVHPQKEQQDVTPHPFQLLRTSSILPPDTSSSSSSLEEFVRSVATECGMAVADIEDVFPCTPLQENLMAISTRRATTTTSPQPYVTQQAFLLSDRVDAARLRAAWRATLGKHGLLRSRVVSTPRGGVLVMAKKPDPSQCTIHYHAGSLASFLVEQQTQVRFDYGDPLIRVAFVYCSEAESSNKHRITGRADGASRGYIVFRAHHSIYDGWSLQLIWDEVASVYSQPQPQSQSHTSINRNMINMDTEEAATSSPPFQTFVSWVQQAAGEESEKFWRETLADADEEDSSTLFPAVPAGHQPLARAKLTRVLPRRPQIPRHYSDSSITVPTLVQAAWALVLALYGGTTAVTFGAVLSGRDTPMPGIEQLVGPTMATVPRHFRVRRDQSIADFLSHAHRTGLASTAHQHLGLDGILRLGPGPRAACDFRSVVVVQPAEYSDSLSGAQARIGIRNVDDEEHNPAADDAFHPYPLNVEFSLLRDGRVAVEVRFDPDCVEEHRVDSMVRCFDSLCRGIGQAGPEDTLASIMKDLHHDPGSAVSSPSPFVPFTEHYSRMEDVIAYRAARQQDSPALVATGASLTYRELETRATRLARRLLASRHCLSTEADDDGGSTGDNTKDRFVAICMPKSPLAVVAMLAIWKAGAAFTPLNTSHPPSRLTSIVARARTSLVLCSRSTSTVFDGVEGVEVWVLEEESLSLDDASVAEEDEDDYYVLPHTSHANADNNNNTNNNNTNTSIHKSPHPEDAAYLLFTSGSTGEPKGVVVQHRALCSAMAAQAAAIKCTSETRMLQCANFAFDASILEIFAPLSVGGCVCLPDDAERMANLAGFIRRHDVNACTFTPSLLRLLDPADVPGLRTIVSGGEPLTRTDIEAWLGGLPRGEARRRMYNVYGVTEACVVSAAMPVSLSTSPRTVGYPVGASLWLVSPVSGMLAPPGAVGELFLEGPALARGYHKDQPRTQTSFVDDPAWLVDGVSRSRPTRVYRTGDLMYRNGDGSLSFLGRRDGQVKIRGQRVEPDEVANMIRGWISSRRTASSSPLLLLPNAAVTSFRLADCLVAVIPSSQPLKCGGDGDGEAAEEDHPVYDVEGVACSLALHSALATSASLGNKPGAALHAGQQQQRSALSLEAAELDAYLRRRIPEVIVPRAYIAVDSMPVTPSGKLDARWVHRCLETLAAKHGLVFRGSATTTSLSSTSALEAAGSGTTISHHLSGDAKLLQECWAEVLRIHPATLIGEEADFFHMGGSSVTAIRLISLLRSRARLLSYEAVVMHSQLGDMAATLTPLGEEQLSSQQNGEHLGVPRPFETVGGDGAKLASILDELMLQYGIDRARVYDVYPCTPMQEAFMAMSVMHQGAYISFQTLEVPAGQFTDFQSAWHSIHQRHELLRTRIVPWLGGEDETSLQGPLPSPSTALQVVIAPEYETPNAYWRQAPDVDSFVRDVNEGHGYGERLVKLAWVMAEEEEGEGEKAVQVIIAAHHAVYDGFSMAMLWQELGVEMETLRKRISRSTAGEVVDASVAPRRPPFSTYIRHLCLLNQTEEPMAFWRETLRGASDGKLFPMVSSPVSLSSSAPDSGPDTDPEDRRPAASSTRTGTAVLGNTSRSKFRLVDLAHAAWALTVSHYTANPDVVFGVISSGRESIAGLPDLDPAVLAGPTMASAPLRLHVDYARPTQDYLDDVRQKGLDLARFAHVGLQRISQASSDARRACRFESIVVVQPASPSLSSFSSSEAVSEDAFDVEQFLSGIKQVQTPAMYPHPLMVECVPLSPNDTGHREVRVNLGYDPRMVAHELAHRVLLTFTEIMSQLARDDAMGMPLCNLRGLSAEDEALLLERARLHTPNVAVDAWDGALTYAELMAASARLASRLRDKFGDCRGRAFPMLCRKSKWAIVGMLAIWHAGGYLVPMEPTHPIQRLRLVAGTVAASAVLVSSDCLSTGLETGFPCIVIEDDGDGSGTDMQCVDVEQYQQRLGEEEGETPDHYPNPNPTSTPKPTPSDLAYVLFTSGSTGTPKGVMVEHRSLSSSLVALGSSHDMTPATRTMQFASYAFDAMLVEIWSTLVFGGCVCVPSDQQRMNDMTGFITTARVNHLFCTPSLSRTIPPDAVMPWPLEKVSLGGEAMSQGDVDRWCSRGAWLSNGYGPTEACIASTVQVMTQATPIGTVGFPLDSCRLWVVNPLKQQQQQQQQQNDQEHHPSQYELAPIGAIGELYIEGVNVARGYLHDDAKTAAAFLERPPWLDGRQTEDSGGTTPDGEKHHRVYRTGDLAYYNPDGSLRLVGRKDAQVKLRGQRVELGEIEEAIRQRIPPSITVAVRSFETAGHGDNGGDDDDDNDNGAPNRVHPQSAMLLAAFGVGSSPGDDDDAGEQRGICVVEDHNTLLAMREMISRLQQDLRAVLPTYMVPDGYVPLQSLPFNSSGKLDERALRECIGSLTPELIASFSSTSSGFPSSSDAALSEDGPLSKHEALLAGLWMRLLSAYSTPEESSSNSKNKNTTTTRTTLRRGDDFFKLGGDSITAMRLVALARRYDLRLTWRDIVTNPTLSAMAGVMRVNTRTDEDESILAETNQEADADEWKAEAFKAVHDARCLPAGVDVVDVLPPTPVQEDFMNATVSFPGAHVSSLIFTLDDPSLDVARLQSAFDRCAAWFPILRTRLVRVSMPARPRVGPASDDLVYNEMVQVVVAEPPAWTTTSSGSLEEALEAEVRTPPGLGQALSRLRVVLQQPDSGEDNACGGGRTTHLIWTQHHSSYDGWSVRLLLEHVVKAYVDEAYQPPLLSDHLSFSAFATHVRRLNRSAAALAFWSAYLEGARPCSLFNYDRVADPRRSQTMKRRVPLPAYETREGSTVTTATYIVAAWATVVGRLTSSPHDVTLGYTLSGRAGPLAGIEDTVGPLLNKIPLRIRVGEGDGEDEEEANEPPSFSAVVEATQKALLLVSDRADCPRDLQGYVPGNVKNLPLDLVVHPRGTSGGVDLLPGASIGLRASGARLAAPAPGAFSVEVVISDGGIEVVAMWDERAVTREVVDDTVDDFAALLVG